MDNNLLTQLKVEEITNPEEFIDLKRKELMDQVTQYIGEIN